MNKINRELRFTSSDVWSLLAGEIKQLVKPVSITDILKKGQLTLSHPAVPTDNY